MKAFVTGPDGLLGSNLVRELLQQNYEVSVLIEKGKKTPTLIDLPITKIPGCLLNLECLIEATKDVDIVIHCGALTTIYPPRSELIKDVNVTGTHNIIYASKLNKIKRLIYVGSASSFDPGTKKTGGNESSQYNGFKYGLDYIDSKYDAQMEVLNEIEINGVDGVIVNPTFMIGPYDSKPSSGSMILGLCKHSIPGYTKGGKNFIAVKDVAVGIVNAIKYGKKGECYILGNENLTYNEFFKKVANTLDIKAPKRKLNENIVIAIGKMNTFLAKLLKFKPKITYEMAIISNEEQFYSPSKARKELKLPQTPIEVAIKECFEWFKANNYLS
jgi:dihydroflavonol-4-reductase